MEAIESWVAGAWEWLQGYPALMGLLGVGLVLVIVFLVITDF